MTSLKIVAVTALLFLTITSHRVQCSVIAPHHAHIAPAVVAAPAIRYTQIAPLNVHPFAAQVSTFTRGLSVYAAPYAAGIIPGPPAIVHRAVLPAPVPVAHAAYPDPVAHFAPAPAPVAHFAPAPAPVAHFAPAHVPQFAPAAHFAPAPIPAAAPHFDYAASVGPIPHAHGYAGGLVASPHLYGGGHFPAGRSIHAVAPGYAHAAPLLG